MITREIRKKMVILGNRAPFAPQTKDYIDHLERVDWIHMNLKLDGSPLTRENVESILAGEMVLNGRIMDHVLIEKLDILRSEIYRKERDRQIISAGLAVDFAAGLSDSDTSLEQIIRKSTPTLQVYSYTPPLSSYILESLIEFLAEAVIEKDFDDYFVKAAHIHNGFLKIYPFRENNEVVARALMEYYLVKKGYPMVPVTLSETEYNSMFVDYLKTGDSSSLAEHLMMAVRDRLELMIQLTAY
ncbi:MAG: Fic family protein [Firmicutes bacterium]|nr:Fic family protein [Bacillota bacterium]